MRYFISTSGLLRIYAGMLTALFCLLPHTSPAEKYTLADSALVKKIQVDAFDSVQVNPKASLAIAEKELAIAQAIDYKPGITGALISMGFASLKMGDMANAMKYIQDGLDHARQYKLIKLEAGALNRLSLLYSSIGSLDKAFECLSAELKIREALKDTSYMATCYQNLAIMLHKQGFYAEAIADDQKAIDLFRITGDTLYEAITLSSIADIYIHQKQYPQALAAIYKSLGLMKRAETYSALGTYYGEFDNMDSTLYYDNIALQMFTADSDRLDMARMTGNIGNIYTKLGNYKVAEEHFTKALAVAKELSDIQLISEIEQDFSQLYDYRHDYKNAYVHYVASVAAKDSFNKLQVADRLAELNTRFEVKEIEDKNKSLQNLNDLQQLKLQRKNILITGTIAALVAILVIGLLLFRQNKLRADQQKTELEQKQLRAQMNPHFIFNCLNSIQHFVVANDVKNANKYLSGFASLMRQTLENSRAGTITLSKEIAYLENYLALELMRFKDKFTAEIVCADNIDTSAIKIPAMIIQPFIENAIRHGLNYLKHNEGKLVIKFYLKGSDLFCEIDDNGIGREQSQKLKMVSDIVYESQGMELTRQRLALVSKSTSADYTIEVIDKKDLQNEPAGTTILIKFPAAS